MTSDEPRGHPIRRRVHRSTGASMCGYNMTTIMAIIRMGRRPLASRRRDWWEKASIITPFVSGVVIAIIGLVATVAFQRAQVATLQRQIDSAERNAADDKRLKAGQLTAQFLSLLSSGDANRREQAVVAMRDSLPDEMCDNLLAVVAQTDGSAEVRSRAIEQLGRSSSPAVAAVLSSIAGDGRRERFERRSAVTSALQVGVAQAAVGAPADQNLFILGSTNGRASAPDSDNFTKLVIRGMEGAADEDHDEVVSGPELGRYVTAAIGITKRMWAPKPVWVMRGPTEVFVAASTPDRLKRRYRKIFGLVVAPHSPRLPLSSVQREAAAFASAVQRRTAMKVHVIANAGATKVALIASLKSIAEVATANDLFIIYYAGAATTESDGTVHWLLSGPSEYVTPSELNDLIALVPARNKAVLINACYAGAIAESS